MMKIKLDIEFWKSESKQKFEKMAEKLQDLGMDNIDIKNMLEELYYAVSSEFGD